MARCTHGNVQDYTSTCLDCGRNIYESDEDYYKHLQEQKKRLQKSALSSKIEDLENQIAGLKSQPSKKEDEYGPW